jgi:hypothetical protein
MSDKTVTIVLAVADALVLDKCIERFFGEGDLHDWESASLTLDRETEQWPFQQIRDQLADKLSEELTSVNYDQILENAYQSIDAREWGDQD